MPTLDINRRANNFRKLSDGYFSIDMTSEPKIPEFFVCKKLSEVIPINGKNIIGLTNSVKPSF